MSPLEKRVQSLFSVIKLHLWLHGIGFSHAFQFTSKSILLSAASISLMVLYEASVLYFLAKECQLIYEEGLDYAQSDLSGILCYVLCARTRFLLYTRSKELEGAWRECGKTFSKVSRRAKFAKRLQMKMVFLLLASDAYHASRLFHFLKFFLYKALHGRFIYTFTSEDFFGVFPLLYHPHVYIAYQVFFNLYIPYGAVTVYFYSVCFLIRETLWAFKKKLERGRGRESLISLYEEIFDCVDRVNTVLHPFLVCHLTYLFASTFLYAFMELYFRNNSDLSHVLFASLLWLNFVLICFSASSVVDAAEGVTREAKKLAYPVSDSKKLQFLLRLRDGFPGFVLLDSVVLDSSTLLTGIGLFINYGLLLANFRGREEF